MKRIRRLICIGALLLFLGRTGSHAQTMPQAVNGNNDPCLFYPHQVAAVTCTSSNTISIVAPANNEGIFVCGIQFQNSGGSATFEYGTGALCATNTVTITGPLVAATSINILSGSTQWAIPALAAGQRLCVACGASGVGVGHLTYVQPPGP